MVFFSWFKKQKDMPADPIPVDDASLRFDLVVPMIAGQSWMDSNKDIFSKIPDFPAENWPVAIPYADGLFITYAIDTGPGWEMVCVASGFGNPDKLLPVALKNLQHRGDIHIEGEGGLFRLTVPEERDLSASVVLDLNRWRHAIPVSGDLIVAIPTRTEVLLCAADDEAGVSALTDMAKSCFEAAEGKPVSPGLYSLNFTGLSPLEVKGK